MKNIKNIMVPFDFSKHAEIALDYAVGLAKHVKASLFIMHAAELVVADFRDEKALLKEYNRQLVDDTGQKLQLIQESIEQTEKIKVHVELYDGAVIESITEACKEFSIDLVIMGTLGQSGVKERLFGSKTAAAIGKTCVPMIVVPFMAKWGSPKEILIALDNPGLPGKDMDTVIGLAEIFKARLHVTVFTDTTSSNGSASEAGEEKFILFKKYFQARHIRPSIQSFHLHGYKFPAALEFYIEHHKVDMLVMVSRPQSFWKKIFHPDTAQKMSYHVNIPMLVLPEKTPIIQL